MRFLELVLLLILGVPFLAGFAARALSPSAAGRLALVAAGVTAMLAVTAAAGWGAGQTNSGVLWLDGLSAVMVVLVTFLGFVIVRFSRSYLAGDVMQGRFFSWLCLTLGSILAVILSGHLLLLLAAWVTTSLCLHRLLVHFPKRAGAVFSARKKFVVSRLGDLCLLAVALLLHRTYGTWEMREIFAAITAGQTGGLGWVGLLIVACAALKSAQFPFHSWLPDTMETPTPVSAFMHAGIINAGGFLVIRFSPLLAHVPFSLHVLAVVGAITAAFGAVAMLAQPSVKRALAYSTIAQMGFMMLQCGLGAFGLALLHIVAHSLYKAHAFLISGSTVGAVPRAAIPLRNSALATGLCVGLLIVAAGATCLHVLKLETGLSAAVFGLLLTLALAYGIARAVSAGGGRRVVARSAVTALVIGAASLGLHVTANQILPALPTMPPSPGLLVFIGAIFAGLFLFQSLLWRAAHHAWGRRLYIYALNGFYVGTYANRLLARLWPSDFKS